MNLLDYRTAVRNHDNLYDARAHVEQALALLVPTERNGCGSPLYRDLFAVVEEMDVEVRKAATTLSLAAELFHGKAVTNA